ncbi:MAG: nucleotidyltransferase domain-containing protein [Terriglobia bacterium]|jgi:predicted nucleotidyltransferase
MYNPQDEPGIQLALENLEDPLKGLFRARLHLSERGIYVKFMWADWPEALSASLKKEIEGFLHQHRLRPLEKGSEDWQGMFVGESDGEAATEIGSRLLEHFPERVDWVVAERDNRGKIVAHSFIEGVGEILWHLSWRHVSADPANPKLNAQDVQPLNAAIFDISKWASSRIQPILDALHERLKALYGERFRGLYVFGSYAKPDAGIDLGENSDLDVALILSDFDNMHEERKRFGDFTYDLSLEHGLVISVIPIKEADFREGQTNFTRVISQYAVPVK